MSELLSPFRIRNVTFRNRVVVSPMLTYQAEGGKANDWHVMNLGQYAAGGAGLVFMESTKVDPHGCSTRKDCGIWSDEFVPGLARVADIIHQQGAMAGLQLGHSGRKAGMVLPWEGRVPLDLDSVPTPSGETWQLVGPSAIAHNSKYKVPKELTRDDIKAMINKWVKAAKRAARAGFDVLELHCAHGYLGHQFLSPVANKRTDEYGGLLRDRMRFVVEMATAVRSVWAESQPLFLRISAVDNAGWTIDDSVALAKELRRVGVDVIDCSSGGMGGDPLADTPPTYGYQVPYAARIRREAGIMTMAVGLITDAHQAQGIIRSGEADLIAIGREFLSDPHWPLHAAEVLGERTEGIMPHPYDYWLEKRRELALPPYGGT
ncbi:MAG: NADH:flavin oxidoreductase/NADH oxidase [Mesorhizobium sp.]|nr:MAG: NADH:flavin oxidoreductase/NADH oxidase [Mesorhizobium sp.]